VIAVYKLAVIGVAHPLAWVTGLCIDVAFVGFLWLGAIRAGRTPFPGARWVSAAVYWPLLLLWFASAFGYTFFHDAAAGITRCSMCVCTRSCISSETSCRRRVGCNSACSLWSRCCVRRGWRGDSG
jgi:hypothetical protein